MDRRRIKRSETVLHRALTDGWSLEQRIEANLLGHAATDKKNETERHEVVPFQVRLPVRLSDASENALVASADVHYYKKNKSRAFFYCSFECLRPLDASASSFSQTPPGDEKASEIVARALANLAAEVAHPDATVLLHPLWLTKETIELRDQSYEINEMSTGGGIVYWTKLARLLFTWAATPDVQLATDVIGNKDAAASTAAAAACYRQVAIALLDHLID